MRAAAFFTIAATFFSAANAIQSVSRSGRYLYTADGNRFYIKGVAYQGQGTVISSPDNPNGTPSTFTDPLVNGTDCKRDLPYLQKLGVNTIRTYSVDNTQNHDDCMNLFSSAGIYTIIDLSLPVNGSIDSSEPYWSTNLLDLYIQTIEVFSKYDNLLAVNVGNEVVTQTTTGSAPFVKAAARDIKAYLNSKNLSTLVGYADIDGDQNWRGPLADYLSCDPSSSNSGATAIDLFGLNNYEWCGNSSFEQSYAGLEADFANYNVPAYFSEFGCITAGTPRPWTEVASLYSSQMSDVWSGGIAFSYSRLLLLKASLAWSMCPLTAQSRPDKTLPTWRLSSVLSRHRTRLPSPAPVLRRIPRALLATAPLLRLLLSLLHPTMQHAPASKTVYRVHSRISTTTRTPLVHSPGVHAVFLLRKVVIATILPATVPLGPMALSPCATPVSSWATP